MKKFLLAIIFLVACGEAEVVEVPITTITTSTEVVSNTTTTTTTQPYINPNVSITCDLSYIDPFDSYQLSFPYYIVTAGTKDIASIKVKTWNEDILHWDYSWSKESLPPSGQAVEWFEFVNEGYLKYEIEIVVTDISGNTASDYCIYQNSAESVLSNKPSDNTNNYYFEELDVSSPPIYGSIYISNFITKDNKSSFQSYEYVGIEIRSEWDMRDNPDCYCFLDKNMHIFSVNYSDHLSVEIRVLASEFTLEEAELEVSKYAFMFGQLPKALKKDVVVMTIYNDVNDWASSNCCGNNTIYIYTKNMIDENLKFLEETFLHEATHASLDKEIYNTQGWIEAVKKDNDKHFSEYAQSFPEAEDLSELIPMYIAIKYFPEKILALHYNIVMNTSYNRILFLDEYFLDNEEYDFTIYK